MENNIFPEHFGLWGVFVVVKYFDDGSGVE
jgi:hypothetical protein